MDIFERIQKNGLEQLVFYSDESVGLRAILAIHNTLLGPALGGVRMMDYPSLDAAVADAVELARQMTYRTALADCDLGGGCAILWADPAKAKSEAYFRAFGRFLEGLAGHAYVVMEVGTDSTDLRNIRRETDKVLALPETFGGMADGTESTADGVLLGLKATAKQLFGTSSLSGVSCLVQGLGRVGSAMVERLSEAGATLIVTDLNYDKIKNVQDRHPEVTMVRPEDAYDVRCDIVVSCTPSATTSPEMLDRLKCRAIAGSASYIVSGVDAADALHERGILYTPHVVIDSGEAILADFELKGLSVDLLRASVSGIYRRTRNLLEDAAEAHEAPFRSAVRMVQKRLNSIGNIGRHNVW